MPDSTVIQTATYAYQLARLTNTTDSGFPSRVPTNTKPSGKGDAVAQTTSAVYDLHKDGMSTQNAVRMVFFGTGSDENTFNARVIAWDVITDRTIQGKVSTLLWIPTVLVEYQLTLGTAAGVANCLITNSMLFADTITLTTGNPNVSEEIISPTGNVIAHVMVDIKGAMLLEFTFDCNSSVTDCNALWKLL